MPVKKAITKKTTSLRAKAKQSTKPEKIASSPKAPRNDVRRSGLSVPVYSLAGRASGTMSLPKDVFGQEINQKLLAQALRVYMANQKNFTGSTKTRGEVKGSTAKIYRQKGTGRARHGSIRAPIFVGGGIVFGPKPRKVSFKLPKKMKRRALIFALSSKAKDKEIYGLSKAEKATSKTKEMAQFIKKLKLKSALIVTGEKLDNVVRASRNIPGISVLPINQLNAYDVLRHQALLITKEAIQKLSGRQAKQ